MDSTASEKVPGTGNLKPSLFSADGRMSEILPVRRCGQRTPERVTERMSKIRALIVVDSSLMHRLSGDACDRAQEQIRLSQEKP